MSASVANPTPRVCEGGGGQAINAASRKMAGVTGGVGLGPFSLSSTAGYDQSDAQASDVCPTNTTNDTTQKTTTKNLTTIDNSVVMMNKNSLTSMSESVNQMIVNSITNTTSSSSQNVNVTQNMKMTFKGIAGNLVISGVNQTATIDLSNAVNTDMTAINNVRTDLSTQIMEQFKSGVQGDLMTKASAEIAQQIQNQTAASVKQKNAIKVKDTQSSAVLPLSSPMPIIPPNNNSNIKNKQLIENDLFTSVTIGSPFSLTNDVSRAIKTSISNSVTQNFTHNTVTQLMQAINLVQNMDISAESIGGNVTVTNITQVANINLRQVLTQKMNIGVAIVNGMKNNSGIQTDDQIAIKKVDLTKVKSTTGTRNSSSFTSDQDQSVEYTRSVETGNSVTSLGSSGSSGSSFSSIFSCICCVICCMVAPMLGGMLPQPEDSTEEGEESTESAEGEEGEASTSEQSTSSDKPSESPASMPGTEVGGSSDSNSSY
jgi:hypothetical protein